MVNGGVAERSNAAVLKTAVPLARDRGFESLPLRQFFNWLRSSCLCSYLLLSIHLVYNTTHNKSNIVGHVGWCQAWLQILPVR